MAFQWVFDNAAQISINKRAVVGQSITRNQTVRAVSRGNGLYKFTITMPAGMPWTEAASYINAIDAADRFTKETITINNAGYNSWIHNGTLSNQSQTWSVLCISIPEWTISDRNVVSFSGPFIFMEARV
jgi:hypothetical protein